jgi:hypothetical protein
MRSNYIMRTLSPALQELSSISFIHQSNYIHPYPLERAAAGRRGEQENIRDSNIEETRRRRSRKGGARKISDVCMYTISCG